MTMRGQKTILRPRIDDIRDEKTKRSLEWILDAIEEINRLLGGDIAIINKTVINTTEIQAIHLASIPGTETEGDWQIIISGTSLNFERYESSKWEKKMATTRE